MTDLLIRGGTVVLPGRVPGARRRRDRRTARSRRSCPSSTSRPREVLDAHGLHVLPGALDAHVHFNEPGRTDWEGWATGTAALAAGGADGLRRDAAQRAPADRRRRRLRRQGRAPPRRAAHVDFALWGGLVPGPLDRLDELAERGVVGFKAFMCDTGIDDFAAATTTCSAPGWSAPRRSGCPSPSTPSARTELQRDGAAATGARGPRRARRRPSSAAIERALELAEADGLRAARRPRLDRAPAWPPSPRRAPAASTPPARPARSTSCSPRRTWSGSAPRPSARRRCAPPPSATRCGPAPRAAGSRSSPPTTRRARRT